MGFRAQGTDPQADLAQCRALVARTRLTVPMGGCGNVASHFLCDLMKSFVSVGRIWLPQLDRIAFRVMDARKTAYARHIPFRFRDDLDPRFT